MNCSTSAKIDLCYRCNARFKEFLFSFRHLKNTGDMVDFTIVSEEAISKGIRRIVGITGQDAEKVI